MVSLKVSRFLQYVQAPPHHHHPETLLHLFLGAGVLHPLYFIIREHGDTVWEDEAQPGPASEDVHQDDGLLGCRDGWRILGRHESGGGNAALGDEATLVCDGGPAIWCRPGLPGITKLVRGRRPGEAVGYPRYR